MIDLGEGPVRHVLLATALEPGGAEVESRRAGSPRGERIVVDLATARDGEAIARGIRGHADPDHALGIVLVCLGGLDTLVPAESTP